MSPAESMVQLGELFRSHFSTEPSQIIPLPPSGSSRLYYRLIDKDGNSAIGTFNNHVAENNTYFYFTGLLQKHQINVPEVFAVAKDRKHYLQQDLGDVSLFRLIAENGPTDEVKEWYKKALDQLARFQWLAGRDADFDQCFSTKRFDENAIAADLYYFKYYFADLHYLTYNKELVHEDIKSLSRELGRVQPQMLMFRDFQSRNIFIHEGKVWFIDFQGAMQGAPQYDVASLLWQAKAKLPSSWKEELLHCYLESVQNLSIRVDDIYFRKVYNQFVFLRMLQTLGAYGFRGLIEKKPHFMSSIGPALQQLYDFLEAHPHLPALADLRKLMDEVTNKQIRDKYIVEGVNSQNSTLKVRICSFTYKQGYPVEEGIHGGGFVFDCRGILNPGRKEEYKKLSGLDASVQQFLLTQTRMPAFLAHVQELVSISVDDYLARGFDSLSVSFGCTGGQHRSVFAAEQLGKFLRDKYGCNVEISHANERNWVR